MKEIFLCKYGEIALKGLNKSQFEAMLVKEIKRRLTALGKFSVTRAQSTIYVQPLEDVADSDAVFDELRKIFGIATVCRAAETEKDMDSILAVIKEYIPPLLEGKKSFRANAKRADKRFPLKSPEISALAGGAVLEALNGKIKVSMDAPEATVTVEIREEHAFVHCDAVRGAGGMPVGSAGKAMLLLSGGIDSPVSGYMMAKRGAKIEAVHFESFPYTSDAAKEKVLQLAKLMSAYCGPTRVACISVTEIQERLRDTVDEQYFTLLLRRCMMRLAARLAKNRGCDALVTGESLGQVASQTMLAMGVTDPAADMLVFRPCIGLDKEEIIDIARKINTFETSILPYEDCCTVFTPKHPKTRPDIAKVLEEEAKADLSSLEDAALENVEIYYTDDM
ncbi:MAG: tRNA 4-thiouridine(8) synthase ThiI [Ruminococcaceae bacterium]|nr:tRNA 4-thiouridine(8) synthase ThiI [Oscillospiraceae bacterium]